MQKQVQYIIKGMQRDPSISKAMSDFSFENMNIRITAREENTLLSVTNEKGNKEVVLGTTIEGILLGHCVLNNFVILFSKGEEDNIYRIESTSDGYNIKLLYSGNLGFNTSNPIEAIGIYENENIQKVYWTDGLNQPRVINIVSDEETMSNWSDNSFDFVRTMGLQEQVNIDRNLVANGVFAPGVLQYSFSYYNRYGQESNIFYTSPLYYVSYNNRGADAEDKVGNSFNITIKNLDKNFEFVRIYSTLRTSIDATPEARRVVDLAIPESGTVSYTDNGTTGDTIDPTELLYLGGEAISAYTMTHKDNTLFFGNLELKRKMIDKYLKDYFRTLSVRFTVDNDIKSISSPVPTGYYPYDNQLQFNSTQFRTFKYLETYRFGIQLQHVTGKWSEPIYICDAVNTQHITNSYSRQERIGLPIAMCTLSDRNIISRLNELGYKKIRAVVVYPSASERDCICQGILCPTVYNVGDRYGNAPFAQSSWFTRPNAAFNIWSPASDPTGDWDDRVSPNVKSIESRSGATTNDTFYMKTGEVVEIHDVVNSGAYAEFRHDFPIPSANRRNAEIQCIVNPPETSRIARNIESEINTWVANHSEFYFIDQSIVTLHSPDIEFDDNIRNSDLSKAKLRIVGIVPVTSFASDINIQTSTPPMQYNAKDSVLVAPGIYREPINSANLSRNGWKGLISAPFWFDEVYDGDPSNKNPGLNATAFVVYPWHRNGSLNNASSPDINGYRTSMLDKKKMSNMRYSYNTHYLDQSYIWKADNPTGGTGISGAYIFDSNEVQVLRIPSPLNSDLPDINYYGNVDKVLNITRWDEPISGTLPDESGNPTGNRKYGYPIVVSYAVVYRNGSWVKEQFSGDPHQQFIGEYAYGIQSGTTELKWQYGTDPIRIKYKSTPHAVLALNYSTTGAQYVLPTLYDGDVSKGNIKLVNPAGVSMSGYNHFWDKRNYVTIRQDSINVPLDAYNGS